MVNISQEIFQKENIKISISTRKVLALASRSANAKTGHEALSKQADAAVKAAYTFIEPKAIYMPVKISSVTETNASFGNGLMIESRSIASLLSRSKYAVFMALTIGSEIDSKVEELFKTDLTKAMFLDAAATAAVESLSETMSKMIARKYPKHKLTFRFGVGYGDCDIAYLDHILKFLAAEKIGIKILKSGFMLPKKTTVTITGLESRKIK